MLCFFVFYRWLAQNVCKCFQSTHAAPVRNQRNRQNSTFKILPSILQVLHNGEYFPSVTISTVHFHNFCSSRFNRLSSGVEHRIRRSLFCTRNLVLKYSFKMRKYRYIYTRCMGIQVQYGVRVVCVCVCCSMRNESVIFRRNVTRASSFTMPSAARKHFCCAARQNIH